MTSITCIENEDGLKQRIEIQQQKTKADLMKQYIYYRLKKQITQQELAERLEVSRQVITRFESEGYNPTLDMMVKMAEGMGLELEIKLIDKTVSPEAVIEEGIEP